MEFDVDTCELSQFGLCLLSSHGNTSIFKIPTQKGIDKLNWASGERGNDISFKLFDTLYVACRTDYINSKKILLYVNKKTASQNENNEGMSRLSSSSGFDFRTCCLYCGECVATLSVKHARCVAMLNNNYDTKNSARQKAVNFVKTEVFSETLEKMLTQRKDTWGVEVMGRVNMVGDLFSADALYHVACDKRFKSFRALPTWCKRKVEHMEGNEFGKDKVKEDGFLAVCEYFAEHETDILTVSDFVIKMSEYCEEPYSANWMKTKLLQHYDR